jgi:hypothetical protein
MDFLLTPFWSINVLTSFNKFFGAIISALKAHNLSMIIARARIEAKIKGQIGHPAP